MLSIPDCVEVTRATCEMYDKNLDTDGQVPLLCLWRVSARHIVCDCQHYATLAKTIGKLLTDVDQYCVKGR